MKPALAVLLVLSSAPPAPPAEIIQTLGRRVTIAGGRLALTEPDDNRVVLYDVSGARPRKLGAFGTAGGLGGELHGPHGATFDPARGWVYVADTFNHRVQVFDVAGLEAGRLPRLVRLFGNFGRDVGDLTAPHAPVLLSPHPRLKGRVFVVDSRNDRVQVFDARGRATGTILGGKGGALGKLDGPVAAAFDPRGRVLYVAEGVNRRVSAFDAVTGAFLFAFGQEITMPGGLAVDGAGVVHVTDVGARLVRRYTPRRAAAGLVRGVSASGAWGSDDPAWRYPQSIAVDARGRVYVVDGADDRGRIFSAAGAPLGAFGEDIEPAPLLPADAGPSLPAAICANGGTFEVEVLSAPSPIPLGPLVQLEVRLRDGCRAGPPADGVTLRVDGVMPGHGHGMNTRPRASPLGEGRFGVSGLRFHMPGEWVVHFDVIRGKTLERAEAAVEIQ